jgi:tRNA modification GTPase
MKPSNSTIVSCLTPPGTGAIATIVVRGPLAWQAIRELFQPASKQPLPEQPPSPGAVWFGRVGRSGLADEVVLTMKQNDPLPWLEIHAHGGRQVVAWLLETLERCGLQTRLWSEFLDGVEVPLRAAALALLARTATLRTAAIMLDQVQGAFHRAIEAMRDDLQLQQIERLHQRIDDLLKFASLGRHLIEPWRVVVAGAPNVGKSSLVNALAGFQRSVVAPIPGTTRDMVSTRLAIDGWPVELLDTAGLRDEAGGLERAGIDLARAAVEVADLCVWVVDATASPIWPEVLSVPTIVVTNKCDRPSTWATEQSDLRVSALTGEGIKALTHVISRKLVPDAPPPGAGVPFLASQIELLLKLRTAVQVGDRDSVAMRLSALAN